MVQKDQIANLLRRGYLWAPATRGGADAVRTRILGRPAVLVGGTAGVRRFYDGRLRRRGAFPPPIKRVLFGAGTVHGLDGTAHHERKSIFVDTLDATSLRALAREAERRGAKPARPGRLLGRWCCSTRRFR